MKECVWVYFDLTVYPVASVIFHLFMVLGGQMHVHCHHDYPHVLHCLLASAYEIHSSRSSIVFGEWIIMWMCLCEFAWLKKKKKNSLFCGVHLMFQINIVAFSTLGTGMSDIKGNRTRGITIGIKKIHIYTHTAVFPQYFSSCLLKISVGKSWKYSSECCHFLSSSLHQRSLKQRRHITCVLICIMSQQRWHV